MNPRNVIVPRSMRTMERDARGYPIPWIVMRDRTGKPHFAVNDERKREECIRKGLCGITGRRIPPAEFWFVGGPGSMLHPHGAFIDPPMLGEAAEYAVRVCPYLAARSYSKRAGERIADGADFGGHYTLIDPTMDPERPPLFGMVCAAGWHIVGPRRYFKPFGLGPITWWRGGVQVEITEAERAAAMAK